MPSTEQHLHLHSNGAVINLGVQPHSGGQMTSLLNGSGNLLYAMDEAQILTACTPLPKRLLLRYLVQTEQDVQRLASAAASAGGVLGLTAGAGVLWAIDSLFNNALQFGLFWGMALALWVPYRAYAKTINGAGTVWELSEWIDFTQRTWRVRKHYTDRSMPDLELTLPLAALALFSHRKDDESGHSFDIGLCKLADLEAADEHGPDCLNEIHTCADEAQSIRFGNALAALWGIGCYRGTHSS